MNKRDFVGKGFSALTAFSAVSTSLEEGPAAARQAVDRKSTKGRRRSEEWTGEGLCVIHWSGLPVWRD
jgi:hypothetical protein